MEIQYSEPRRIPGRESEVRIASIQMEPEFGNIAANLEKTLRMIREAAAGGAKGLPSTVRAVFPPVRART